MPQTRIEGLEDVAIHSIAIGKFEVAHLSPSDDTYAMPATQGQLRFWSLDQLNPGNPALNMPLMWQCTGDLNAQAMAQAFAMCLARHEALRTTFDLVDGQLTQIIHPATTIQIPIVNLEPLEGDAQRAEAARLTRDHAAFHFDLKHGPLLVLKLLRFSPTRHLLLVTMHHIICDGISNGILLRDMVVFYESILKTSEPVLPTLPIQFADYAVWQQQWLASEEPAQSLEFWHQSLGREFSRITLQRDEDAAAALAQHPETTGDIETLLIPPPLQARASAFCKRENVTLNILLFSIFAALLRRLTGQNDLTIGSPCANRTEDTEELIGLFMNIQVMHLKLDDGETFQRLLRRVEAWTLGAYENQALPFENLIHDPYFHNGSNSFEIPIFFLYQKSFMVTHHIGNLEIVPLRSESPGAVFEIMFAIVDRVEDGPRLQLEYNPQFFKASTIQGYLRMFVELLESALDAPDTRVDELNLLTASERSFLLEASNQTATDFGPFAPVASTFLTRASAEPEAIAIECGAARWTNAQLATYARSLAQHLLASGLAPGGLVGICVERSPQMVGAVLAVMLAGAAYVPLDPRHPTERLQMVLDDSGATILLTTRDLALNTTAKLIDLTQPFPAGDPAWLPAAIAPQDLAYVIYTSGSTGKPKGVAIEHAALMNLLHSMQREPGLTRHDTLVAITTLAFDIAGLELLLPLLTGAKLIVATDPEVLDGRLLLGLLERTHATVLQATPGAWRILIDAGWQGGKQPLKALCGGEALPRDLAEKLLDRAAELWNVYGPTETTIWSSATRVVHQTATHGTGPLRIGPPIANTQFYVLDARLQPTPIGVPGELHIGGAGLARGYWNRPELTAEKFLPNPFGTGRIYATGDLARIHPPVDLDRVHPDGSIELLGRTDFQVKIRGYRIELAEIEAAILQHPQIKETVVTSHKSDASGITRLAAYLAVGEHFKGSCELLSQELLAMLSRTLPDYLIPNAVFTLPALPRNTNGKIDRKALPGLDPSAGDSWLQSSAVVDDYVQPQDIIEQQLADIWQTTLGLPRISVRANFFTLGVGSLAALRLITKMNRVFAMDLGLASLISASTIESIAELIRKRFAPNTSSSVVPLQPKGSRPPLFILHGVGGNIVNFYGLAMRLGFDQPVYGIQSQALLARQPALLRITDMAAHYIADVRKVQPHGPYHLLGYSFGGTVVLEMAHQLRAVGEEVALIGMIDSKSKDYEEQLTRLTSVQTKINRRVNRFRGNTGSLGWNARLKYIAEKVTTRAIRLSCTLAASLHMKQVPAFMRSAYDINYVAVQNYKTRPYDGQLILFRATWQGEEQGEYDLGWNPIFKQSVIIHDLPGDHERIFLEPNIEQLAASLRDSLTAVGPRPTE
jgi:amino acid adenylation domain-containing protein